jgi:hypothetical protein
VNIPTFLQLPILFGTFTGDMGGSAGTGGSSFNSVTSKLRCTTIAPSLALLAPPSFSRLFLIAENFEVGILPDTEFVLMCSELLNFKVVWDELRLGVRSEEVEKCWNSFGSERDAKGRRADIDAQIMAVPTSTTDQLREPTV